MRRGREREGPFPLMHCFEGQEVEKKRHIALSGKEKEYLHLRAFGGESSPFLHRRNIISKKEEDSRCFQGGPVLPPYNKKSGKDIYR